MEDAVFLESLFSSSGVTGVKAGLIQVRVLYRRIKSHALKEHRKVPHNAIESGCPCLTAQTCQSERLPSWDWFFFHLHVYSAHEPHVRS